MRVFLGFIAGVFVGAMLGVLLFSWFVAPQNNYEHPLNGLFEMGLFAVTFGFVGGVAGAIIADKSAPVRSRWPTARPPAKPAPPPPPVARSTCELCGGSGLASPVYKCNKCDGSGTLPG